MASTLNYSKRNTTLVARKALFSLLNDPHIRVDPTDKNLGIAVALTSSYNSECLRHLRSSTSREITEVEANSRVRHVHEKATVLLGSLFEPEDKEYKFALSSITPATSVFGFFSIIWKVHKKIVVGRPLIAPVKYITTPISKLLDSILRPVVNQLSTVCKDSLSLINSLESLQFPDNCVLSSKDVTSLYPSIPIQDGCKRVADVLYTLPSIIPARNVQFIVDLLMLVLLNNICLFEGTLYLQLEGTAMGTSAAVCFAIIFMFSLENDLVTEYFNSGQLLFYTRFIDDIFSVFRSLLDARSFWIRFSAIHPNIVLTGEDAATSIDFLDLTIYKGPLFSCHNKLDFRLFQKHLNNYLYLPYSSYHEPSTRVSFVLNELRRYAVRSCLESLFIPLKYLFLERLKCRGFPYQFLRPLFRKVGWSSRVAILHKAAAPKAIDRRPPVFSIPWNPLSDAMDFRTLLRKHWTVITNDPILNTVFTRPPLVAFKRSANIASLINNIQNSSGPPG